MKLTEILANKDTLNGEIIEYDGFLVGLNRQQKYLQYFSDIGLLSVHQPAPKLFLAQDQMFMRYLLSLFIQKKLRAAALLSTGDESFQLELKCTGRLKFISDEEIYLDELTSLEVKLPINPHILYPIRTSHYLYKAQITYGEIALRWAKAMALVESQTIVQATRLGLKREPIRDFESPIEELINGFVKLSDVLFIENHPIAKTTQNCFLWLKTYRNIVPGDFSLRVPIDSLIRDITQIEHDFDQLDVELTGRLVKDTSNGAAPEDYLLTELIDLIIKRKHYIFPPRERKSK